MGRPMTTKSRYQELDYAISIKKQTREQIQKQFHCGDGILRDVLKSNHSYEKFLELRQECIENNKKNESVPPVQVIPNQVSEYYLVNRFKKIEEDYTKNQKELNETFKEMIRLQKTQNEKIETLVHLTEVGNHNSDNKLASMRELTKGIFYFLRKICEELGVKVNEYWGK